MKGTVLDSIQKTPLPYVNILILKSHRGTITNEAGTYALNYNELNEKDTVSFQFIGYKTKNITFGELAKTTKLYLSTDVMGIDEVFITNNNTNPEAIIKEVIKNKHINYKNTSLKNKIFSRERYITDIEKIELDYKKSSIKELNQEMIQNLQENAPKNSTSYFDFLANFYISKKSSKVKLEPIQSVELLSKDLRELDNYKVLLENLFADTKEKEYWKIKSGIFGEKLDLPEDSGEGPENSDTRPLVYFKEQITDKAAFATLEDKDLWEFLYKTNRYQYSLEGSTSINGESVYIINFTPNKNGQFEGTVYITTDTYALLKATYQYSEGKTGTSFSLLGMGYSETDFKGAVYFEKNKNIYQLKYFTFKKDYNIRIDRKISLQKKKDRFLIDRTLQEIKLGLKLKLQIQETTEFLALESETLSEADYDNYNQPETFEVISINQFDETLWEGYNILEPTKQLKNYKKLE